MVSSFSGVAYCIRLFSACVLAPVWEELLYRGFVMPALGQVLPLKAAVLL